MKNNASNVNASIKTAIDRKSLIIRVCRNRHCNMRYEVTEEFQTHGLCPDCRKPKMCIHNVKTTERCEACFKVHGNVFSRIM